MASGSSEKQVQTEQSVRDDGRASLSRSAAGRPVRRLASARNNSRASRPATVSRALANLVFTVMVVGLTYLVTSMVTTQPSAPEPIPEKVRIATQRTQELRAEERRLLTTYGPPSPVTGAYRIPIDRAMELSAAEGGRPRPLAFPMPAVGTVVPGAAAPKSPAAGTGTTAAPAVAVAAATTPPRVGMAPQQLFAAVCFACHGPDGRGTTVRAAMPVIPDFTDPKWQASRTDADLTHSILQGKGQLMLPMKDKLELAHTDVKDMVAFIRSFQSGGARVAAPAVAAGSPALMASPAAPASSLSGAATSAPLLPTTSPSTHTPALAPLASFLTPAAATPLARPAGAASAGSDRARIGGAFFNVNCIPCHGPDGRGNAVRLAMPVIPDFTSADWQKSHQDSQLAMSILEGKGTLMPAWRGRVDPELARNLVAFVRTFAPAGLVLTGQSSSDFAVRMNQLRQQWDELERQARALSPQ